MELNEFLGWLIENGIKFETTELDGDVFVYVYGHIDENGYKPYIRVSHWYSDELYVRNNGLVYNDSIENICNDISEMCA